MSSSPTLSHFHTHTSAHNYHSIMRWCTHYLGRGFCETWLLLVIVMSDITNGGVQQPIDGYNSLDDVADIAHYTADITSTTLSSTNSHPKWMEPYFDPSTPRNVTALMGKSAYLSCRVRNLGNKTVSWIRHRDVHILTVGAYTYTSDQRFQATHHQDTDDWTLQIKWAQKRDGGTYECQISTQPVRSYFVHLNVVVPTATILGAPDLHVDKGSTINLTCTVKFSPEPPAYIFWYHQEEVINYDSSRGGVSVITEKGDVTTSFLLIQNADLADSGKYSCSPSNADVASVRVHVLNGEHPEAMQTGSSGCQYSWLTILLLVCTVLWYNWHQKCQQQQQLLTQLLLLSAATTKTSKRQPSNIDVAVENNNHSRILIATKRRRQRRRIYSKQKPHNQSISTTITTASSVDTQLTTTVSQQQQLHSPDPTTSSATTATTSQVLAVRYITPTIVVPLLSFEANNCQCQCNQSQYSHQHHHYGNHYDPQQQQQQQQHQHQCQRQYYNTNAVSTCHSNKRIYVR